MCLGRTAAHPFSEIAGMNLGTRSKVKRQEKNLPQTIQNLI